MQHKLSQGKLLDENGNLFEAGYATELVKFVRDEFWENIALIFVTLDVTQFSSPCKDAIFFAI